MKENIIAVLCFFLLNLFFSKHVYANKCTFPSYEESYINYWDLYILEDDMDTEEFTFCGKDGFTEIDLKLIKNTIELETELPTNNDDGVVYISTENGFILKIDDIKEPVPNETILCDFPGLRFTDIAVDENKVVYVTTKFQLYVLDVDTCTLTSIPNVHQDYRANSLSFDLGGNLYYGNDNSTLVYRYDQDETQEAYVWHDFGIGFAAGDFVILNGKMYIAWKVNNDVRLYEVEIDNNFNYVSHVDLGRLDPSTFGLASENGELYGIASHSMYKISLNPFSEDQIFWNATSGMHGSWWGAAGLHEAQKLSVSIYENSNDLANEENELPDLWINTIAGGQVLQIKVENEETGEFEIKEIKINIETINPGEDAIIDVCSDDNIDLFSELGTNAETGGTWTGPDQNTFGTSHIEMFDPKTNLFGTYTYTVTTIDCELSATVNVRKVTDFDTGLPNSIDLCIDDGPIILFDSLQGIPDANGIWRDPNGIVFGSDDQGVLDPSVSGVLSGDYEYVLLSATCNTETSTKVTVEIKTLPTIINENIIICIGGGVQNLIDKVNTIVTPGGIWLAPNGSIFGTDDKGEFDPAKEIAGIYSYIENDACGPSATVTVKLSLQANSGISNTVELCSTDLAINLFDELGGTPDFGGVWTDPNGIVFGSDDQGNIDPSLEGVLSGDYTYTVSTTACPEPAVTIAEVIINKAPSLGTNGSVTVCTGGAMFNLFEQLGGSPDVGGIWKDPNGVAFGTDYLGNFDPSLTTNEYGVYTYSITTNFCEEAFSTVEVTLGDSPNSGTAATVELCSTDLAINLFDELGGIPDSGGVWTDPNGIPFGTDNQGNIDPSLEGVLSGDYTYTVSTTNCPEPAVTIIEVIINKAPSLGTNGSVTVCTGGAMFNLFEQLGDDPDTGGIWKDPNGIAFGTDYLGNFDPSLTTNEYGVYTYSITTNFCEEAFSAVEVTLGDSPNSGISNTVELCSTDLAINLFDELGGTPDSGGVWADPNGIVFGSDDQGSIDPSLEGILSGDYTYTVSTTACTEPAVTIIEVIINKAPSLGTNGSVTVCTGGAMFNLFEQLGGSPDAGGIWKDPNGVAFGTGHLGNFDASLATNEYGVYTYSIATNFCEEAFSTVEVTLGDSPNSGIAATVELCSTDLAINLFDELGGIPDSGGVWTDPNGIPFGTDDQGNIDPSYEGVLSGNYTYRVSTPECPTLSETIVEVTVNKAPSIGTNGSVTVCTGGMMFNLFEQLGGNPDAGGIWKDPNGVAFGTGYLGNFDPSLTTNEYGVYTYSIATNFCEEAFSAVEVILGDSPNSGIAAIVELCSTDLAINLFDELGGTPNSDGVWTDPKGLPLGTDDKGNIDPSIVGVLSGEYSYTVSTTECPIQAVTIVKVNVAITPEIMLEDKVISEDVSTYDVSFLTNGTWDISVSPNVGQIDVQNSKITKIPFGIDVEVTVKNPLNTLCFNNLIVETPVFVCPTIDSPSNPSNKVICNGDVIPELSVNVKTADGELANWYSEDGRLLQANNPNYTPEESSISLGDNIFLVETVNASGLCFSDQIVVSLFVKEMPQVNLITEGDLCLESDGSILSENGVYIDSTLSEDAYAFEWELNDEIIKEETGASIFVFEPGEYKLTYTDLNSNSCFSNASVKINALSTPEKIDLKLSSGNFASDNDLIATVIGGTGNFEYSLDDGEYQKSNVFTNISLGAHKVMAIDLDGCGLPISEGIYVMGFPKFFSPNGDNINDTWNINQNPLEASMDISIFVYDRFGKLIKQVFPNGSGWDGTFAGKNMPSDDYWFIATMNDTSETYKSHFTLKR